jgi:hypothetical protein
MEDGKEGMIFIVMEAPKDGSCHLLWRGLLGCELVLSPAAGIYLCMLN